MPSDRQSKYIFVTGGVVSSLGKGLVAASVGALLQTRGLRVTLVKADPYINVDPGTMNPRQHGEVFVTDDGAETDLDLGHYERFTSTRLTRANSFSTGQIYDRVISNERQGEYLGGTVQVVPHLTDIIKKFIFTAAQGVDIAIVEIGGTVGDIESLPFLEAIRQIRSDLGNDRVLFVHVTLIPYLSTARELKTKPTQHSVKNLRQTGIQPDILVCRCDRQIPERILQKISLTCDVGREAAIQARDLDSIYKLPLHLHEQKIDQVVVDQLNIWSRAPDLTVWQKIANNLDQPRGECQIAIVGKYIDVIDSYLSVTEALVHAGISNCLSVKVTYIDAEQLTKKTVDQTLAPFDGIIVPAGFGKRGSDGKILAITHCRQNDLPFLGICYGMQLAAVEFARHQLGISRAGSAEFGIEGSEAIIDLMPQQRGLNDKGATMRLGSYPCLLLDKSKVQAIYGKKQIDERHRHRFEFNNRYRQRFEEQGMSFSGLSPDGQLVEIMELSNHPWFICCQFHPELKSSPHSAHPLFRDFIATSYRQENRQ